MFGNYGGSTCVSCRSLHAPKRPQTTFQIITPTSRRLLGYGLYSNSALSTNHLFTSYVKAILWYVYNAFNTCFYSVKNTSSPYSSNDKHTIHLRYKHNEPQPPMRAVKSACTRAFHMNDRLKHTPSTCLPTNCHLGCSSVRSPLGKTIKVVVNRS